MSKETARRAVGVKKYAAFLLLSAAALAAGCAKTAVLPKENARKDMREYVHKNNLSITLPPEFSAAETNDGFAVEPVGESNKTVRYPVEAAVALHKGETAPEGSRTRRKSIGNRRINYRVEKSEVDSGSGGAEYEFSAYETVDGGYIFYVEREQSEDFEPKFDCVWQIIEHARLVN